MVYWHSYHKWEQLLNWRLKWLRSVIRIPLQLSLTITAKSLSLNGHNSRDIDCNWNAKALHTWHDLWIGESYDRLKAVGVNTKGYGCGWFKSHYWQPGWINTSIIVTIETVNTLRVRDSELWVEWDLLSLNSRIFCRTFRVLRLTAILVITPAIKAKLKKLPKLKYLDLSPEV